MTTIINMHDAKSQLSRLVDQALAGEEVVIARAGEPQVRLVPIKPTDRRRTPGCWAGKLRMAPDFDATPPDVIDAFEQNPVFPNEAAP